MARVYGIYFIVYVFLIGIIVDIGETCIRRTEVNRNICT